VFYAAPFWAGCDDPKCCAGTQPDFDRILG